MAKWQMKPLELSTIEPMVCVLFVEFVILKIIFGDETFLEQALLLFTEYLNKSGLSNL